MNERETQALQAAADAYANRTDQLRISDEEMAGQLTMDDYAELARRDRELLAEPFEIGPLDGSNDGYY